MPIKKEINRFFFKKWSIEMAYVLGFIFADGSLGINNRGSHYLDIQIIDRDHLYKIRNVLESNHKISHRPVKRGKYLYRLQIGSKEIFADLMSLGLLQGKTHKMRFPFVPKKYLKDFIRGYFDGDGNVWVGKIHKEQTNEMYTIQTVFTSCSKKFLKKLQEKLGENNIKSSLVVFKNGNFYRLQISLKGSILIHNLMYNSNNDELYLERKKAKFEEFIKMRA